MNPDVNPRHGYYQSLNPIFPAEMYLIPSHSPIAGMEMCSIQTLRVMNATIRDMRAGGQLGMPGSFSCNACLGFLYLCLFADYSCLLFLGFSPAAVCCTANPLLAPRNTSFYWMVSPINKPHVAGGLARALNCGGELPGFPIRKTSRALAISTMTRRQDDMFP